MESKTKLTFLQDLLEYTNFGTGVILHPLKEQRLALRHSQAVRLDQLLKESLFTEYNLEAHLLGEY